MVWDSPQGLKINTASRVAAQAKQGGEQGMISQWEYPFMGVDSDLEQPRVYCLKDVLFRTKMEIKSNFHGNKRLFQIADDTILIRGNHG
jgi:hypothetical protein